MNFKEWIKLSEIASTISGADHFAWVSKACNDLLGFIPKVLNPVLMAGSNTDGMLTRKYQGKLSGIQTTARMTQSDTKIMSAFRELHDMLKSDYTKFRGTEKSDPILQILKRVEYWFRNEYKMSLADVPQGGFENEMSPNPNPRQQAGYM